MIGYVIAGPVLALLVSMKFTTYKAKQQELRCEECCTKTELVETKLDTMSAKVDQIDQETLKRMLVTITPVAKAVKQLQESIGVQ